MRLTVDSLVDIGNITTRPDNITLRQDKVHIDKDLIEKQLY